eukprot:TRINITY_DN3473_c0_g1_i1.p1 TRINITY_DN3473_c0_g1~~TRINITY_DN3473_c0_g1_i1.p1  ORF type:complete len:424 (-),score=62.82 TRINITY_DN3473_c0_g1_i1:127-1398(-)
MIEYRKGYLGYDLIFRLSGTSWPHGIIPGVASALIGLVLSLIPAIDEVISDETRFCGHPYPYQLFAYLVGFVLVFRTNFGYQRYWEAYDALQRMGSKWLDAALMTVAFDAYGDPNRPFLQSSIIVHEDNDERELKTKEAADKAMNVIKGVVGDAPPPGMSHHEFFVEISHYFSLMHCLALQHLRNDQDLDHLVVEDEWSKERAGPVRLSHVGMPPVMSSSKTKFASVAGFHLKDKFHRLDLKVIGGVTVQEKEVLSADHRGASMPSHSRVSMVESWIMRRLMTRQKFEAHVGDLAKTPPPITSRLVQNISDGNLAFFQACKVAETPFPFPYHNMIRVFLWMFALTCPLITNAKVLQVHARFVVNFFAVWAYFSLAEVGDNLEDPYIPYDPNELPLEAIHHHFNSRLLALGVVPKVVDRSPGHS